MRTSELFGAKDFEFFEIYGVSALTTGIEPVRTFCDKLWWGFDFSRFCVEVFYVDGPLVEKMTCVLPDKILFDNVKNW